MVDSYGIYKIEIAVPYEKNTLVQNIRFFGIFINIDFKSQHLNTCLKNCIFVLCILLKMYRTETNLFFTNFQFF